MASRRQQTKRGKQKLILAVGVTALIILIVLIVGLTTFLKKYSPSKEVTDYKEYYSLSEDDELFVVYDNEQVQNHAILQDDEVYVNYQTVHKYLNKRFYWDATEQVLRYVTPDGLINVTPDSTQYLLGKSSETADHVIALVRDGEMYLSMSFVQKYTDIHYEVYTDPGRIVISDQWDDVTYQTVKKNTQIRQKGGVKSPILSEIKKGDLVTVLDTVGSWSKVCSQDGFIGYMKTKAVGSEQDVLYDHNYTEPKFSHITRDKTINMAWHQVTNQTANGNVADVLGRTKGVNVISPTWFYLNDNSGNIASLCSSDYVTYCHQQGIEVWGLVSNLENSDVDSTSVLNLTSSRDNLVNNLVAEAIKYDLDGINVDFESLSAEAADGYLEFIRELSIKCENNDIVLSVDNYVPKGYNMQYNRKEQGIVADYVIIMGYDEHFAGSPEAGSVSSYNYVKEGISETLKEVPANKVISGIPFFTRLWEVRAKTEDELAQDAGTANEEYTNKVTSKALGMDSAQAVVKEAGVKTTWDDETKQNFASWTSGDTTYSIWLEDEKSMEYKLQLMKKNKLAGTAEWALGQENSDIWQLIQKYVN